MQENQNSPKCQNRPSSCDVLFLFVCRPVRFFTAGTRYRGSTSQLVCVFVGLFLDFSKLSYLLAELVNSWTLIGRVTD